MGLADLRARNCGVLPNFILAAAIDDAVVELDRKSTRPGGAYAVRRED
jgi:hypothetical protein